MHAGTAQEVFPVCKVIPDVWTNVKSGCVCEMPFVMMDYQEVKLANGTKKLGAIFVAQTRYV